MQIGFFQTPGSQLGNSFLIPLELQQQMLPQSAEPSVDLWGNSGADAWLPQPQPNTQSSSEVPLNLVFNDFARFDTDGDNKLSKQEIAQAALTLKSEGRINEFMLFATFLQGGKDGKGLFPDDDQDGCVSYNEIADLAKAGGNRMSISSDDFKAKFPDLVGSGNTIDIQALKALAYPDEDDSTGVPMSRVLTIFDQFDQDGDGKLSKQEIARAALEMANEGRNTEFTLFATFLQGGKDGTGLFPDDDGDGYLSRQELEGLAGADGDSSAIKQSDFAAKFPDLVGGGNAISTDKLNQVAYPNQYGLGSGNLQNLNIVQLLQQLILSLFTGRFFNTSAN